MLPLPVSAVDCVQPALQHTREQLFTRFRFSQWLRLALVAILAAELHVGGCNFGGNFGHWPRLPRREHSGLPSWAAPWGLPSIEPHISAHIGALLGLLVIAALVGIVLAFVFLYINSVFRFILFDSVLRRECSIGEGWRKWHRAGVRFFLWQLVFQIAAGIFFLILIGVPLAVAAAAGLTSDFRQHRGPLIAGLIVLAGLLFLFVLAAVAVQVLAKDFLVPIMALENLDFADGWHRLLAMIGREKGRYAVYLLLKLVLSVAAGILFAIVAFIPIVFAVIIAAAAVVAAHAAGLGWSVSTISLAVILGTLLFSSLIYVIALLSTPATVFFPAYAMYFLAARYPHLDVLLNPAPTPPAPVLPPLPESPPPFEPPPLPPSTEPIG